MHAPSVTSSPIGTTHGSSRSSVLQLYDQNSRNAETELVDVGGVGGSIQSHVIGGGYSSIMQSSPSIASHEELQFSSFDQCSKNTSSS